MRSRGCSKMSPWHFHRQGPSLLQSASCFQQLRRSVQAKTIFLRFSTAWKEAFFQRLEIYTEMTLDRRMVDTVAKIMAETLNVLAITTNEISQGRIKKYFKKLIRNKDNKTDIENALKRLDRLADEEAQMAAAQVLKATHTAVGNSILAGWRSDHHPIPSARAHSYVPTTTWSGANSSSTPHHQEGDLLLALA